MKSEAILANINQIVQLNTIETEAFESMLISRPFKQGELIIKGGDPARYMVFVNSGYLMTYYTDKEGADHVVQFAASGWWCSDIYSISEHARTPYSTKSLGDGEVLLLPRPAQQQLLEKYIKFEKYFRILFQNSVIRQQQRFLESYSFTAEERYDLFAKKYPGVERYVPQKYIASYLGITPEFLSKTRKKLLQNKS